MKKYFEVLRKCSLFDDIADGDLTALLGCLGAKVYAFNKNDIIIAEGDAASDIGIVLSGKVQIIQIDFMGNRSILSEAGPGQLFAEAFACADIAEIPVSVVADSDSEVMFIKSYRTMHSCSSACEFHRKIIFNLMRIMAAKNIMFHRKIQVTSKRSTREKLLTYLNIEAKRHGSARFDIPFDRQELADYLEVDRSGLSAEISKLRRENIIKNTKNHFVLL